MSSLSCILYAIVFGLSIIQTQIKNGKHWSFECKCGSNGNWFDDDGVNEMALSSDEVSGPIVGSISMPSAPTLFESITTPSTSNPKAKAAWELLKIQLNLN